MINIACAQETFLLIPLPYLRAQVEEWSLERHVHSRFLFPLLRQQRLRGGDMLIGTRQIRVKSGGGKKKKDDDKKASESRRKKEEAIDDMIDEVIDEAAMMQPIRSLAKKNQASSAPQQEADDPFLTVWFHPLEILIFLAPTLGELYGSEKCV
jgi:hypothetical protein